MNVTPAVTAEQQFHYKDQGCCFPVRILDGFETNELLSLFLDYLSRNRDRMKQLPPRESYFFLSETHTYLPWVYRIVSHPRVLDAVETILGPNLLVWSSRWFAKMPGDKTYVGWHQDATYWGLRPPNVTTAWIALSESVPQNGCMRIIPGSHKSGILPHNETYADNNALSRGQEIAVDLDESQAIDVVLAPGEMSLHSIAIVHGSKVNHSDRPRIGVSVQYLTPDVVQEGAERPFAILLRGEDNLGHFDLLGPPTDLSAASEETVRDAVVRRMMKSILPESISKLSAEPLHSRRAPEVKTY